MRVKEFQLNAIEVIRVGKGKMAAYAIGKGEASGMDWSGLNLRYRKLTPLFGELSDCIGWLEQNFKQIKFVRYYKGSWSVKGFGGHYESAIAKQSRSGSYTGTSREIIAEIPFNTTSENPFCSTK